MIWHPVVCGGTIVIDGDTIIVETCEEVHCLVEHPSSPKVMEERCKTRMQATNIVVII